MKILYTITIALLLLAAPALAQTPAEENSRYKLARGYEAAGDIQNAARVYKELLDGDPNADVYFEAVRRTYTQMLKFAELLPVAERRVRARPADQELRVLYADLLSRNHRSAEADEQWEAAIKINPDDPVSYGLVGASQAENQLFRKAAATFLQGRSRAVARKDPNPGTLYAEQLAQVYAILNQFDDASAEYLNLLAERPVRIGRIQALMAGYTSNPKGAAAAIAAAESRLSGGVQDISMLDMLSWLYTEAGQEDGALRTVKRLDDLRRANGSSVYAFADRAMREGRYEAAMKAFEYVTKNYGATGPLYTSSIAGYTESLEKLYRSRSRRGVIGPEEAQALLGRYMDAAGQYKGAEPAADVLLRAARLQADDLNNPEPALKLTERILKEYPKSVVIPQATLLQADLQLRLGRTDKAMQIYKQCAAELMPGRDGQEVKEKAALRVGEVLFYTGQFHQASDAFQALTVNSGSDVTNDALEYLFLLQENMERDDSALKHYATGRLYIVQRRWKDVLTEMDIAAGGQASLADDALSDKALALEETGQIPQAVSVLMDILAKYPKGTVADRALFTAAELTETRLNDPAKAGELYLKLLSEYPSSSYIIKSRQRIRALRGGS